MALRYCPDNRPSVRILAAASRSMANLCFQRDTQMQVEYQLVSVPVARVIVEFAHVKTARSRTDVQRV